MGSAWTYFRNLYSREDTIERKSPEGQDLLNGTDMKQLLLVRIFTKQEKMGYCGVQSSALLMSARFFGQKSPDSADELQDCDVMDVPYVDYKMFSHAETTRIITRERALSVGMTLAEVGDLLRSHGIPTQTFHTSDTSVDEFRTRAIDALSRADSSCGVNVNYLYDLIAKDGTIEKFGHHSPLAAYHRETDRFLVLDTWIDGQELWYFTVDLYRRMNTFDEEARAMRGFNVIGGSEN